MASASHAILLVSTTTRMAARPSGYLQREPLHPYDLLNFVQYSALTDNDGPSRGNDQTREVAPTV